MFSSYLELHLGISSSDEYLQLYDELTGFYRPDEQGDPAIDLVHQAESICTRIRGRLHRTEHIMVFLRFMELAGRDREDVRTAELFKTVAEVFAITAGEAAQYRAFVSGAANGEPPGPDFLVISSQSTREDGHARHLFREFLDGEITFLFLREPQLYLFIFRGRENLYLEGNPILPGRFYAFREGSIIRGTRIEPVYFTDVHSAFFDREESPPFTLTGEHIAFRFKNSPNGLHEFSFSEPSGQLIAIMGGSGVGKSTLLNVLNGTIPIDQGSILINDIDIHKNPEKIQGLIGFVPQDDLLFEELTVWENLRFNARLCLAHLPDEQIDQAVERVLLELELHEARNLLVGSPLKKFISGGQRKRLNIALELIREPAILFVDEPTSGLSSMDSEKVMLLLKNQARKGKLLIVNIHQPSSDIFKMFDKLWVMDKGGRMIYTGNPLDAIIYFKQLTNHVNAGECECLQCGNVNPEQVLEIVETKKIDESGNFTRERRIPAEEWYRLFRERQKGITPPTQPDSRGTPPNHFRRPGIGKQLVIFLERNLKIKLADKQYLLINLIEAPLLAVIVGFFTRYAEAGEYVFANNKNLISFIFMAIVVVLFMSMSVSAEEIIKDRKILQRESFLNLSRLSYLNSKVIFLVLLSAIQTLTFVLIGNLITGIHGLTLAYWLILFSVAIFSNLLGLNISSALDSVVAVYILIPLLLIPQILLCGVIVKFDDLQDQTAEKDAVPVVGDLMVSRWAFEALAVEQFANNRYMARFFEEEKRISQARFRSELLIPELLGRVDYLSGQLNLGTPGAELEGRLTLLRNEITKLDRETPPIPDISTSTLTPSEFSGEAAVRTREHLLALQEYWKQEGNRYRNQRDAKILEINEKFGKDHLYELKRKYHNLAIEELVLNNKSREFFRETSAGLMQKVAPVYKSPDHSNGRAHFLASEKRIFGLSIGTFGFNLTVIWLMSIFLYLALYFDWLRKILSGTGRLFRK
ncbi:MAG: ATP-binding cassette domain-containing protein [Bacteroidales bacterium]